MKRNPLGYRQADDKPTEVRTGSAHMQHSCNGNGEPVGDGIGRASGGRRNSPPCVKRKRQIKPGDEVRVAYWSTKPLLTIHCTDCAKRYLGQQRTPE